MAIGWVCRNRTCEVVGCTFPEPHAREVVLQVSGTLRRKCSVEQACGIEDLDGTIKRIFRRDSIRPALLDDPAVGKVKPHGNCPRVDGGSRFRQDVPDDRSRFIGVIELGSGKVQLTSGFHAENRAVLHPFTCLDGSGACTGPLCLCKKFADRRFSLRPKPVAGYIPSFLAQPEPLPAALFTTRPINVVF